MKTPKTLFFLIAFLMVIPSANAYDSLISFNNGYSGLVPSTEDQVTIDVVSGYAAWFDDAYQNKLIVNSQQAEPYSIGMVTTDTIPQGNAIHASVEFHAPNGLTDSVLLGIYCNSIDVGRGYFAFLGRDSRLCGKGIGETCPFPLYLGILKSVSSGDNDQYLFAGVPADISTSAYYRLNITGRYVQGRVTLEAWLDKLDTSVELNWVTVARTVHIDSNSIAEWSWRDLQGAHNEYPPDTLERGTKALFGVIFQQPNTPIYFDKFLVKDMSVGAAGIPTTVGIRRPSEGKFYIRFKNQTVNDDLMIQYGNAEDLPLAGDWNGNRTATIGVYRPSNSTFYLRNSNTAGSANIVLNYGNIGDIPVVGDWNGDGITTIGVYRPSNSTFYLRNSNTPGGADIVLNYGNIGDLPVVGDWNGDGITTIGIFRPSNGTFYLRNSNTPGGADLVIPFIGYVQGDVPVAGDWTGKGYDTVGIWRPVDWFNAYFLKDNHHNMGVNWFGDHVVAAGLSTDKPVVGKWIYLEKYNLGHVHEELTGYAFGDYDGRYVYFAPCYKNSGYQIHGNALRYDTQMEFTDPNSWEKVSLPDIENSNSAGFHGATVLDNYVYYSPLWNITYSGPNGTITRYYRPWGFESADSWEHYDISTHSGIVQAGLSAKARGYVGSVTDGTYVYFAPYGIMYLYGWDEHSGLAIRYNKNGGSFSNESAWEWFNLESINASLKGYHLAGFDGYYVYYAPYANSTHDDPNKYHGKVVRFNVSGGIGTFNNPNYWEVVDLQPLLGLDAKGFYGAITSPGSPYIYFPSNITNKVVRLKANATTQEFTQNVNNAWEIVDITQLVPPGSGYTGSYAGGWIKNGRVYLAPDIKPGEGPSHGVMAIHDLSKPLNTGWTFIDLTHLNSGLQGFHGAAATNNSLYLIPDRWSNPPGWPAIYTGWFGKYTIDP